MKQSDFIQILTDAYFDGCDISVEITIPNQKETEYIINKNSSIINKLKYYCEKYDENLVHKNNPEIKIVSVGLIKDGKKIVASNEKIVTCENCEQDFVLKETDKRDYGEYGIAYVLCPNCKEKCYLEDEDSLKIDGDNLEFPKHFSKFGVSDGAVHIDDIKIQEWSRQALSHLIKHPEDHFYHIASGDSIVIGLQYDDEIYIVVGKNYHEFAYTKEEE